MKPRKPRTTLVIAILAIWVLAALAGCQKSATPTEPSAPSPDTAQLTIDALQAQGAQLGTRVAALEETLQSPPTPTPLPTETPIPTETPTPAPTIAVPEDQQAATHLAAPGYVFLIDPELWTVENTTGGSNLFLAHSEIEDCRIDIAPAPAFADLVQYYPRIIGRRGWLVEGYAENTYFVHQGLRIELSISEDEDCILAQETVLEDLLTQDEYDGAPASTPAALPTTRPTLQAFTCEDTLPTRLRVGDRVLIVAGFLWLREEPLVEEETKIRLFQQYAPAEIQVTSGPTCADGFVFWEVRATELGEGGETFTGWMAEASAEEYFLDIWYLGW